MHSLTRHLLGDMLFRADTEYAELLLGVLSTFTGLWLLVPAYHCGIHESAVCTAVQPEVWGVCLSVAGLTKIIGIWKGKLGTRLFSCKLACFVWLFLCAALLTTNRPLMERLSNPLAPITLILALANGAIHLKLGLVRKACGRST